MKKISVAFVCVGNSCRSQMSEGFAKKYGKDVLDVYSAGTHPAFSVNESAIEVMKEIGIDISNQKPKTMEALPHRVDYLISMGCGVVCPYLPNSKTEDWGIQDPVGKPIEYFRQIRNEIELKVKDLIQRIKNQ